MRYRDTGSFLEPPFASPSAHRSSFAPGSARLRRGTPTRRVGGFTLIELLVVIAIIALLVSILMPSLQKAKELAKDIVCRSHQRNVSLAIFLYIEQSDDMFPYSLATKPFGGDPYPPDLNWPLRVGVVTEAQVPYNFLDEGDPEQVEQKRICMEEGSLSFNWWNWREGSFKCPAAFDQINDKPPIPPATFDDGFLGYGWGSTFSINGHLSWRYDWEEERDGEVECRQLTDVKASSVLIGDGSTRTGGGIWFNYAYTVSEHGLGLRWNTPEQAVQLYGPWPFSTFAWGQLRNYPVDWYGHPGESANLSYTDGHVENHKTIDRKYWRID